MTLNVVWAPSAFEQICLKGEPLIHSSHFYAPLIRLEAPQELAFLCGKEIWVSYFFRLIRTGSYCLLTGHYWRVGIKKEDIKSLLDGIEHCQYCIGCSRRFQMFVGDVWSLRESESYTWFGNFGQWLPNLLKQLQVCLSGKTRQFSYYTILRYLLKNTKTHF